ncbi:hypothetical protein HPP92_005823 [Vanilla planifolia]|uniref:Phosphofructokinase domain-containing protein n=1 Tax=Vanilla planifolia TaxID=51239 RepID=A0A835RHJ0_VANPL|nr:hypothetical protein HPP92_005823 [Vanilla planifolia]
MVGHHQHLHETEKYEEIRAYESQGTTNFKMDVNNGDFGKDCIRRRFKVAVVGVPKTIDNDILYMDRTFGFDTAVEEAQRAINSVYIEAHSAYHGIGIVKLMGRNSGFIAMHASLASGQVDVCLIPEDPFTLHGPNGVLRHLSYLVQTKGSAVVCVAEGAGQNLLEKAHGKDASGNKILSDIGIHIVQETRKYFKEIGVPADVKYVDPTYMIRACRANAADGILCTVLGQNAQWLLKRKGYRGCALEARIGPRSPEPPVEPQNSFPGSGLIPILAHSNIELTKMLLQEGQGHLFAHWAEPGVDDDKKKSFFDQVLRLRDHYPGGLTAYIQNARRLLADSRAGKNPFEGFIPSVPSGEDLKFGDDNFVKLEEEGVKEAKKAAFVLVAGVLENALVALPSESTTGTCFLQHYIECILALQEASCKVSQDGGSNEIPLVIMTSDDTHMPITRLLESNSYFGMQPGQVKLLKQEKVACLDDNDARIALESNDKYKIQTKPHGHGDVHALLYKSGLLKIWHDAGLNWVIFFQDTNGLLFKVYHIHI